MNVIDQYSNFIKETKIKLNIDKAYLHEPYLMNDDVASIKKALNKNQISTYGKFTNIFEDNLKKYLGIKNLICLINGTSALHLAIKTLGIKKNHEVFVSPLTFISTVNAIRYCEAEPHFYDIDKRNLSINLEKFSTYLNKNTKIKNNECINLKTKKKIKALVVTHVNGFSCQIDNLKKICKKNKLLLIEDSAESLGCKYKGKHLGTFGDAGILSFNGNKIITTGGGGALIFKKKNFLKKAFHLSNNSKIIKKFEVLHNEVGYNYRLPSLNSALGITQLKKLQSFILKKKKLHLFYLNSLKQTDFKLLLPSKNLKSNYWLNTILVSNKKIKEKIIYLSKNKNFNVRPIWKPIHLHNHFKKCQKMNLDNTMYIYDRAISLPSSVFLSEKLK